MGRLRTSPRVATRNAGVRLTLFLFISGSAVLDAGASMAVSQLGAIQVPPWIAQSGILGVTIAILGSKILFSISAVLLLILLREGHRWPIILLLGSVQVGILLANVNLLL